VSYDVVVVECQPDTTPEDLQGSVSSQTIDQSTVEAAVTYKPTADNSQQMSTENSIKYVAKNTKIRVHLIFDLHRHQHSYIL